MLVVLLIPLAITTFLASRIPGATAQGGTNATCNSGFEWMFNSKNQNPCLVSSWLFTPCSSPSGMFKTIRRDSQTPNPASICFLDSFVFPLTPGFHYNTPLNSSDSATPCRCNTVLFSTIAACATCQGGEDDIVPWILYSQNCSSVFIHTYPENIPSGTAIPAWAYLDVRVNGTFDPAAAEAVAAQNLPESTALPAASQTINTKNPASQSTVRGGTFSSAPTAAGHNSSSGSKKTNAGAIAGGVVGSLAGIALIAAAVFVLRRRVRRRALPVGTQTHTIYTPNAQSWEKSPVISVSTHKLYNPNDPRTFPGQDPYARGIGQGSVGTNFDDSSNRGPVVANPNAYRGAPEL